MLQTIEFQGAPIRYSDHGSGYPLVFLHGYLLALDVWTDFTKPLSSDYRIICMDMLGHGESGLPAEVLTMEVMADAVKAVFDHVGIDRAMLVGHSMGGYASLAFLEKYANRLGALALFHSHTLADSEEVRIKRDREVKIIDQGQRSLLISQSIPNMFATDTLDSFNDKLDLCKQLAQSMSDSAVVAAIKGLKSRSDRSTVLENAGIPCLNIIGRKDNFIDFERVALKTRLPAGSDRVILESAGHMGFFEEPKPACEAIRQFANSKL